MCINGQGEEAVAAVAVPWHRIFIDDGIFIVDGVKWRHQWKVANHDFSTRVLRAYNSDIFRDTYRGRRRRR